MINQSKLSWGVVTKALHWTIAALIISIMSIGIYAGRILTYANLSVRPLWGWLMNQHKALGCIVLGLVVVRAIWTFSQPRPELPAGASRLHRRVAATSAVSLYMLMVCAPIAGIGTTIYAHKGFKFFGIFEFYVPIARNMALEETFKLAHQICAYTLLGLLLIHISAALMHHFILRDQVLRRMWFQQPAVDSGAAAGPEKAGAVHP
ncbi:MAG TPA: cytochrome b [Caulobacteraceae bacterium]|nr:cytochrome b [Caulobacteraceae bacterium]